MSSARMLSEAAHRFAIAAADGQAQRLPLGRAEPDGSAGDGTAGHEALEVPLERARQCLVEVVDAEHEPPVGRLEPAEVGEMGVPAQLHLQARSEGSPARSAAISRAAPR